MDTKTSLIKLKRIVVMMKGFTRYAIRQSVAAGPAQTFCIKGAEGTLQRPYERSKVEQTLANRFVQDLQKEEETKK